MKAPKNSDSDAMNSQMPSLLLLTPVLVSAACGACGTTASVSRVAIAVMRLRPPALHSGRTSLDRPGLRICAWLPSVVLLARGLGRPCIEPEERDQRADPQQPPVLE